MLMLKNVSLELEPWNLVNELDDKLNQGTRCCIVFLIVLYCIVVLRPR